MLLYPFKFWKLFSNVTHLCLLSTLPLLITIFMICFFSCIHFWRQHWILQHCCLVSSIFLEKPRIIQPHLEIFLSFFWPLVNYLVHIDHFLSLNASSEFSLFPCFLQILYLDAVINLAFALSLLCFIVMHVSLLSSNTTSIEVMLSKIITFHASQSYMVFSKNQRSSQRGTCLHLKSITV